MTALAIFGAIVGASGAALLAVTVGIIWSVVIFAAVAFIATHFNFGTLESQLFTGLSVLVSVVAAGISPWFVGILGAVAGFMMSGVILTAMDRPNVKRAREEAGRRDAV